MTEITVLIDGFATTFQVEGEWDVNDPMAAAAAVSEEMQRRLRSASALGDAHIQPVTEGKHISMDFSFHVGVGVGEGDEPGPAVPETRLETLQRLKASIYTAIRRFAKGSPQPSLEEMEVLSTIVEDLAKVEPMAAARGLKRFFGKAGRIASYAFREEGGVVYIAGSTPNESTGIAQRNVSGLVSAVSDDLADHEDLDGEEINWGCVEQVLNEVAAELDEETD